MYCKVFDNACNKLISFKYPKTRYAVSAVSMGNRTFILEQFVKILHIYDVDNDKRLKKLCEAMEDIYLYFCAKVPLY